MAAYNMGSNMESCKPTRVREKDGEREREGREGERER